MKTPAVILRIGRRAIIDANLETELGRAEELAHLLDEGHGCRDALAACRQRIRHLRAMQHLDPRNVATYGRALLSPVLEDPFLRLESTARIYAMAQGAYRSLEELEDALHLLRNMFHPRTFESTAAVLKEGARRGYLNVADDRIYIAVPRLLVSETIT